MRVLIQSGGCIEIEGSNVSFRTWFTLVCLCVVHILSYFISNIDYYPTLEPVSFEYGIHDTSELHLSYLVSGENLVIS